MLVPGHTRLVHAHARGVCPVQLQAEGCDLDGLLLIAGEVGETIGKGVDDTEIHGFAANSHDQASQAIAELAETRRLVALNAHMRPDFLSPFVFDLPRQWPPGLADSC